MNLIETVGNKYHGLPGIGTNLRCGSKGPKGRSMYIGHILSFFDTHSVVEEGYGYIRIKNQDTEKDSRKKTYYYRKDENFFRRIVGVDATTAQMVTFSIKHLRGINYDKYSVNSKGKKLTLQSLVQPYTDEDGNQVLEENFAQRKENIDEPLEYTLKNAVSENAIAENSYDVKIEYHNPNKGLTNASPYITSDIAIPTVLSDLYQVGDILYIQDDETEKIVCCIVITEDLVGCTFEMFLKQEFIPVDSFTSSFTKKSDKMILNKNLFIPRVDIDASILATDKNHIFKKNIVKVQDNDALISIPQNELEGNNTFLSMNSMNFVKGSSKWSYNDGFNLVFKDPSYGASASVSNIYVDRTKVFTNFNFKNYNADDVIFVDDFHIPFINEKNIVIGYKEKNVTVKLSRDKFFLNRADDKTFFGLIVFKKTNSGCFEVFENSKIKEFGRDLEYVIENVHNGTYGLMAFVGGIGISTYYSTITEIGIEQNETEITKATISVNDYLDSVTDSFVDNEYFGINMSDLTCENTPDTTVRIYSKDAEKYKITQIFVNNVDITKASLNSWIQIEQNDAFLPCTEYEITASVKSNIPKIEDVMFDNISDYFDFICDESRREIYQIGSEVPESAPRRMVLTVLGTDEQSKPIRASFVLTQPGFENVLEDVDIKIAFEQNNNVEKINNNENGLRCNQVQAFAKMSVENFSSLAWARYLKEPRISFQVQLDKTRQAVSSADKRFVYFEDSNQNNIQVYSLGDLERYPDSAVKTSFSWLKSSDAKIDSDFTVLAEKETQLTYTLDGFTSEDAKYQIDGWAIIDPKLFRNRTNQGTLIPYGLNYTLDDKEYDKESGDYNYIHNWVGGLTTEEANKNDILLRILTEVNNPIPMEMNWKWVISCIKIEGKLRDEFVKEGEEAKTYQFFKFFEGDDFIDSSKTIQSDRIKFIVNPVSVVIAPEDIEQQGPIKGSIKKVGSEEGVLTSISLMGLDKDLLQEYNRGNYYDQFVRYEMSKKQFIDIANIQNYAPKLKYFQDNVTDLTILKKERADIFKYDSDFKNLMENVIGMDDANYFSIYNIVPIEFDSDANKKHSSSYISMSYNSDYMLPQNRDGQRNFYFNDKLYDVQEYSQWQNASPLWLSFESTSQIIDSSLLHSKQAWNFEYEVSSDYDKNKVFGGYLTKSGNGFNYLSEEYDTGQYEVDKLFSLKETKEKCDAYLDLNTVDEIIELKDVKFCPKKNKLFRAFVYDLQWICPYFYYSESNLLVHPYYISDSLTTSIDKNVFKNAFQSEDVKLDEAITTFSENNKDVKAIGKYAEEKLKVSGRFINIKMNIPYNLLYDVYPRVLYNSDQPSTYNILMLQRPSVCRRGNYTLDKQYLDMPKEADNLPPWSFDKYSEEK